MPEIRDELLTLRDLLRYAVSRFSQAKLFFGHGCDNAWDEAVYLLLHTLHLPLDRLEPFLDARLTAKERDAVLAVIERRVHDRVPAAYITKESWLGEHRFYVDERVIVPRSFIAELLEEQLAPWIEDPWAIEHAVDVCTGSGCLAIIMALAFPNAHINAIDLSPDALDVAKVNIADYAMSERVQPMHSNLYANVAGQRYDLIVSNPPYVNAESMATLPEEYRHEPEMALAGGDDGLNLVRTLIIEAKQHLNPGGLLVVEIGHNRDVLEAAFPETPFTWLETETSNEFVFLLRYDELP